MFEFLFKYSPYLWSQGEFVLSASPTVMAVVAVLGIAALPGVLRYRKVTGRSTRLDRAVLGTLRVLALALLAFCLLRPSLVVSTAIPQENFVGILLDDSRSMQIADRNGVARSEFIAGAFGDEGSELLDELSERFKLRFFAFGDGTRRITAIDEMAYGGDRTRIGPALETARQELASVPLAGLVVVTDGADNSLDGLGDALQSLRAAEVPVFPVGLGAERFDRDLEVARVEAPRAVLVGSQVAADVVIEQKGFDGETVLLMVEGREGIVGTQEVELPRRGESTLVKAHFTVEDPGAQIFKFRVAVQDGEMVTQNNEREVLVHVREDADRILHFEGEPTHDVAFIRRVVSADDNLQLYTLNRLAENKYLHLSEDPDQQLAELFPKTREELFRYKGLVLGSIEPDFFTDDQLQMIVDFVSQRGGGLMMFGGNRAFSEGGWARTPVADILPVVLGAPPSADAPRFHAELQVVPTLFGRTHAVTQLADTVEASLEHWRGLPALSVVNPITETKPGASTLLTGSGEGLDEGQVVLAYQRYGSGKVLTFTPFNAFLWQMQMPLEDMTHETFWRQLLRWLVHDVPGPVEVATGADRFSPGETVEITARVRDETFIEVNNAEVVAAVTTPSGDELYLPMDWSVETDGEYKARFNAEELGLHRIVVDAARGGTAIGDAVSWIETAPLSTEYFGSERRTALLERMAEETGGRAYTRETISSLPGDLEYSEGGTTVVEVKDLWDLPAIFLAMVLLVATEWSYRKWRKLA